MIISRTPLRVSFAGGGTDLPAFYNEEPGAVVSTAIDKYIYITTNKKFDSMVRASYSETEIVETAADLKHALVRECLKMVGIGRGIEITSISDIPSSGTGLGSSSTYTVGLLNALYAYVGKHASPGRLAKEACEVEIDLLGNPIGKQDQYAAAFGGLRYIQFNPDGTVFSDPIVCDPSTKLRLEDRLLMLYTGTTRSANDILSRQSKATASESDKRATLRKMKAQADQCRSALEQNCLDEFGALLHEGWTLKKELANGISNPQIDDWYDRARKHGAIGGKILGAGGGGFLLIYAHSEHHNLICEALPELKRTKFQFEPQGSKIIFVEEPPHQ
jgi:D-glycero-alpha-D-manno-heptose-7-phosphate kinase